MSGSGLDATVVVATYNRRDHVATCVRCLLEQDYPHDRYEVVVVDDGSTDGTDERIAQLASTGPVGYLRQAECRGQGSARNLGIRAARGAIVIFVDSDAFAPPWFVGEHVTTHASAPGRIVDGPAINVGGADLLVRPRFDMLRVRSLAFLDLFGASFVTVNASCARGDLEAVGGFDETFGAHYGWEDVELGARLQERGLGRIRNRRAYVLHHRAAGSLAQAGRKEEECGANAVRFYRKHPTAQVLKSIHAGRLGHDRLLARLGLPPDRVERICLDGGRGGWRRRLLSRAYLVQQYAKGLRRGMRECEISLPR